MTDTIEFIGVLWAKPDTPMSETFGEPFLGIAWGPEGDKFVTGPVTGHPDHLYDYISFDVLPTDLYDLEKCSYAEACYRKLKFLESNGLYNHKTKKLRWVVSDPKKGHPPLEFEMDYSKLVEIAKEHKRK